MKSKTKVSINHTLISYKVRTRLLPAIFLFFQMTAAVAMGKAAVLDFELNDITSLPNTPAELQRTATLAPLLRTAIGGIAGLRVATIPEDAQKTANGGFGYLFSHPDLAAGLGREYGVDWLIVGQHSKPSFLFSYLRAYLIDVKTQNILARYEIELKGNHDKVTRHGIDALAKKIRETLYVSHGDETGSGL